MAENNRRTQQVKTLRIFRSVHRKAGALLFVSFIIVATTGLLLGWKKHSCGLLLPPTMYGASTDLKNWLPLDSLHTIACTILRDSVSSEASPELDRIDIRKERGTVKFVFANHYRGIQLDGTTGELLLIERRRSDLIEDIHDGSVLDFLFSTGNEQIKLAYTSLMGLALLMFAITGFWLWYTPKRMNNKRKIP